MRFPRRAEDLLLRIGNNGISIKEMLPEELFALLWLVRKGLVVPSMQTADESGESQKQRRKRYVKAIYAELYLLYRPLLLPLVSLFVSAVVFAFSLYRFLS